MGKKEKRALRVVLDTNVLVSAPLFRGEMAAIVGLWKGGRIVPVVSKETFGEFMAVLEYPKFRLTKGEIRAVVEEDVLPFFEVVEVTEEVGVCRDPEDDKFISCALAAGAGCVVTGDRALCDLGGHGPVKIIKAADLPRMLGAD